MSGSKGDLFLFYYSGHAEAACFKMGNTEFPLDSFKQELSSIPADIRIGIFDACQSGSFTRTKGGRLDEPFLFREDEKTKGQVLLSSSSIDENAQESDALGGSVFTFYFINALRGSADMSGDGRVTLTEAYHYSYNRTIAGTAGTPGGAQHPSYQFRIQGEGDIVLADLNGSRRGIFFEPELQGAITVVDEKNAVVADLSKEKGNGVLIALPAGKYRIYAARDMRRYQTAVAVAESKITRVMQQNFIPELSGLGRTKGMEAPFAKAGVACGYTVSSLDFSRLSGDLKGYFTELSRYSIDPRFAFPKRLSGFSFRAEAALMDRYIGYFDLVSMDHSAAEALSGEYVNPIDGNRYASRLNATYSIGIRALEIGAGYRFSWRYLANVSITAGAALFYVTTRVNSIVYDSLYDITTSGQGSDQGYLFSPALSLCYVRPVTKYLDIGARVRGRYQRSPRELQGSSDDEGLRTGTLWGTREEVPLRYDFTGVDANLYVSFNIRM
jgi:hypothetical protein